MQALIALGSNLGCREQHLGAALDALAARSGKLLAVSPVYETEPDGLVAETDFLNAVCAVETALSPEKLLELLLTIEQEQGRVRDGVNRSRTLDLDLLFYENETRETSTLVLPHPRFAERAFVCLPLRDLLTVAPLCCGGKWEFLRALVAKKSFATGFRRWPHSLPRTSNPPC